MTLPTTSTVPAVKAQLVSLLTTGLLTSSRDGGPVTCLYAWNPEAKDESVFLGVPLLSEIDQVSSRVVIDSAVPTIKAGRKQRQENYTIVGTCWCFRPDTTPANAADAEARVAALYGVVEDTVANDPTLGLSFPMSSYVSANEFILRPFQSGWAAQAQFSVDVSVRLT